MDPIAAFKAQQARNGTAQPAKTEEKSITQLREANPRWATIFDKMDTSADGYLQLAEVLKGFKQILGAGSQVPEHHLKDVFAEVDTEGNGDLDFKAFVILVKKVSSYMMDHPKWVEEEAALDAKDEKKRLQAEKERKEKEGPDIFAVLGLPKPKEFHEVEARKKRALSNATNARQDRLSLAKLGSSIVRSGSQGGLTSAGPGSGRSSYANSSTAASETTRSTIRRASAPSSLGGIAATSGVVALGARKFLGGLKRSQASIESTTSMTSLAESAVPEDEEEEPVSPTKKLREMWERFSLSSARGRTSRQMSNVRQIHLPEHLPQIRVLGKKNAACNCLRFSPDGSQVAGGFFDGGIRVFDTDKSTQVHCMNLPKYKGGSVRSAEEQAEAKKDEAMRSRSGSEDVQTMDMDIDEVDIAKVMKAWEPVTNLRWQHGGSGTMNVLATVDTKGELALWDVPRNKESRPSRCLGQIGTGDPLSSLAWNQDGSAVAVGGNSKVIQLYDVQENVGKAIFTAGPRLGDSVAYCGKITGHTLKIVSVCNHPTTPQVFVSAGLDSQILLWDVRTGKVPVHSLSGPELIGDACNVSKDGNCLLVGSHRSKNPLEIYDLRMNEEAKPTVSYAWRGNEESSEGGGRWTTCLLFSACWDDWENKTVVAAGENENLGRVFERSVDPGEPLRIVGTIRGKEAAFCSSAISTGGDSAAFGSADGAVCLVDVTRK